MAANDIIRIIIEFTRKSITFNATFSITFKDMHQPHTVPPVTQSWAFKYSKYLCKILKSIK